MNRRTLGVVALALLLLPAAVQTVDSVSGSHVPAAPHSTTPWWGPTALDAGHHIRVGVAVQNPVPVPVDSLTVRAELDLAKVLTEAGWTHTGSSSRPLLKGFHFDEDSVRVVRVSGLNGGSLLTQDASRGTEAGYDLSRLVPSLVVDRLLDSTRTGNPSSEPLLSVHWQVHDLGARGSNGDTQYFHVYLDTRTNGDHGPADIQGTDVGAIEALHWTGVSTTYYGAVPPTRDNEDTPTVTVLGIHPDTVVQVELRQGPGFKPHPTTGSVTIQPGGMSVVGLGTGQDVTEFRLTSDRPFVAYVTSTGFVPSLDGGLAGRDFMLRTPTQEDLDGATTTTLNIIAPHARPVTVTASSGTQGFVNSGGNPRPYTLGIWNNGCPATPPAGTLRLNAGTTYRLSATDDVLVQVSAVNRVQQVPGLTGGPTGTEFAFPMTQTLFDGSCLQSRDSRSWWISSVDGTTQAFLDSPERQGRIDPTPTASNPTPHHTVPASPDYLGPRQNDGGLADRPLYLHAEEPSVVWAGSSSQRPITTGPLARDGGLAASGIGPAIVFAYHDETTFQVKVDRAASGTQDGTQFISRDGSFLISDLDNDPVNGWRITSDKPIVAYGLGGRAGYLAGMPLTATIAGGDVTIGRAEFRGYLLDIASADGVEPQTQSTIPGTSVSYRFVVTNMARNAQGSLVGDTADIEVGTVPPGWKVELDRSVVPLGPGATETVTMTVVPPDNAVARSSATIPVRTVSQGNPGLSVSSGTVTYIQRSFDVGIWFGTDINDGPRRQDQDAAPDQSITFPIMVKNKGTSRDAIDLNLPPQTGSNPWSVRIQRLDGSEISQVVLDGGKTEQLQLEVTPPQGLPDGRLSIVVKAISGAQPSAFDAITAVARVRSPADIQATSDVRSDSVLPGEEATFPIHVVNNGAGSIELDLDTAGDLPDGWSAPRLFFVHPTTGDRTEISTLSIGPGEELDFVVATTLPDDALAGDLGTVRVLARPPSGNPVFEMSFAAVTAARHDILMTSLPSPLMARADGQRLDLQITVTNAGNLDETLAVDAATIPPGWTLNAPDEPVTVARGTQKTVDLGLTGPVGAPPQEFDLTLRMRSIDGTAHEVVLPTAVPDANGLAVSAGAVEPGQPGRAARIPLQVVNAGNAPARVTVEPADGEPWSLVPAEPLELAPGASASMVVGWMVPGRASLGPSDHDLHLVLEPTDGGARVIRTITATVDVDRPQLQVNANNLTSAPGGTLVVATVQNTGNRTAHDVRVQLRAGGQVVDEVVVSVLASGDRAVVSLLDEQRRGKLELVLDPEGSTTDPGRTERTVLLTGVARDAPSAALWALLLVLAGSAWVMRRPRP